MDKDDKIFDKSDYLDKLQQGRTASKEAGWYLQGFRGTGAEKHKVQLLVKVQE